MKNENCFSENTSTGPTRRSNLFTVKIGKQPLVFQIAETLDTHRMNQIDPRTCAIVLKILYERWKLR